MEEEEEQHSVSQSFILSIGTDDDMTAQHSTAQHMYMYLHVLYCTVLYMNILRGESTHCHRHALCHPTMANLHATLHSYFHPIQMQMQMATRHCACACACIYMHPCDSHSRPVVLLAIMIICITPAPVSALTVPPATYTFASLSFVPPPRARMACN